VNSRRKSLFASLIIATMLWAGFTPASQAADYPGREQLSQGAQNEHVKQIQQALVKLGYSISPTNGRYGPQTVRAVSQFYSARGNRSDGTSIGPAGYKAILNSAENAKSPPKKTSTKKKASKSKAATRKRFREMGDPTLSNGTRKSRSAREQVSFEEWKDAPFTKYIATKESNRRCKAVNRSGKYRGRWQMDRNFWASYGGQKFAKRPDRAKCAEQDLVAYRGWIARGWQPWNY
jgi:peptidoglycan hydrolase-like protein with peptidoglycan-binding domain